MRLLVTVITVFLLPTFLFSQDTLFQKEVKLKSNTFIKDKIQSFPIVNSENDEILMNLLDKNQIKCFSLDSSYNVKDSLTTDRPKAKYNILLGHTFMDENYSFIFTNESKTKFWKKEINLVNRNTNSSELDIDIKGEVFLEAISNNNKLYIVTIKKFKSILNIYEIIGNEMNRKKEIDIGDYNLSKTLHYLLFNNTAAIREEIILSKIDNSIPVSLDVSSFPNKIYCYNNTIYLSIDLYDDYTKVISINLLDFSVNVDDFPFNKVDCELDLGVKSNSFLLGDRIYQVNGCKNEMSIVVYDFVQKKYLFNKTIRKEDEIDFKNSSLIQLGGAFNKNKKYKELKGTEQILRKIEGGNIGIAAYNNKENIEVTIGGYKKMSTKEFIQYGAIAGVSMVAITSGISGPTVGPKNENYFSNPVMYSFENYSYSRSVYFKSLRTNNLEAIQGNIEINAFDKIRTYTNENHKRMKAVTIFKNERYYALGFYNKKEGSYNLLKFSD